jgi:hypothetical protein
MPRARGALLLLAATAMMIANGAARDRNPANDNPGQAIFDFQALSKWFAERFPGEKPLQAGELRTKSHECGCSDTPTPHFPYRIVLIGTPKGDLVARPEGSEGAAGIVPIAMRFGERYCTLDSTDRCYGSFSHPCDFTDFRFGSTLEPYFPSCKAAR